MADSERPKASDRFKDFEGPTEDERTTALRNRRIAEGHSRPLGGARGGVGLNRIVHRGMIHSIK